MVLPKRLERVAAIWADPERRADAIRAAVHEGAQVEASGVWQGRRVLHAYSITDTQNDNRVQAHESPEQQPGERPLGHTARFVVDHALCDVVVLALGRNHVPSA
jgi:hypothetical protein